MAIFLNYLSLDNVSILNEYLNRNTLNMVFMLILETIFVSI